MRKLVKAMALWLSLYSKRGITSIEYALIASLIALAIIASVKLTGTHLAGLFSNVASKVAAPHSGDD